MRFKNLHTWLANTYKHNMFFPKFENINFGLKLQFYIKLSKFQLFWSFARAKSKKWNSLNKFILRDIKMCTHKCLTITNVICSLSN